MELETYNNLELFFYNIFQWFNKKFDLGISVSPDEISVFIFFIIFILGFMIAFIFSSQKNHIKSKKAFESYNITQGICVGLERRKIYTTDSNGNSRIKYQTFAKIKYNGIGENQDYFIFVLPYEDKKNGFDKITENSLVKVYYNPENISEAMIERDIKSGLKDNGFKGFIEFLKVVGLFVGIIFLCIFFLRLMENYLKRESFKKLSLYFCSNNQLKAFPSVTEYEFIWA